MIGNAETLAKKLGLRFNDPDLFKRSLTHRSAERRNNERLEFLGDSVLGFVIAECLYEKFGEADEGVLSRLRATLVNQTLLASLARDLNLGEYLILGSGELKSGGYRRDSILSDALEAIIGAILKDQGMDAARKWILELFAEPINRLTMENWEKDPKTRLQELLQGRGLELPIYLLLSQEGLPHDQYFRVECRIQLMSLNSQGEGTSRKKAEQQAAERMLAKLSEELGTKP
ncbi:Ribonuclease 3 [Methylococcales bacterium]|nr:Ribonuclease 3 [Methylococcales bacterium]